VLQCATAFLHFNKMSDLSNPTLMKIHMTEDERDFLTSALEQEGSETIDERFTRALSTILGVALDTGEEMRVLMTEESEPAPRPYYVGFELEPDIQKRFEEAARESEIDVATYIQRSCEVVLRSWMDGSLLQKLEEIVPRETAETLVAFSHATPEQLAKMALAEAQRELREET